MNRSVAGGYIKEDQIPHPLTLSLKEFIIKPDNKKSTFELDVQQKTETHEMFGRSGIQWNEKKKLIFY